MSRPMAVLLFVVVIVLLAAHEIALRLLIDYEVAGALLAVGGSAETLLAVGSALLLRLLLVFTVACLPAVAVWQVLRGQCVNVSRRSRRKRSSVSLQRHASPQSSAA